MKEVGKYYCDVSKVHIAPIAKPIAKDMIIKYHYSHAWTMCRYALGVYYKTDAIDILGNSDKLIGCIIYGYPVGRSAVKSVIDGLEKDECLELTRLFIHDGYGSNIESYVMGQSFKWLKQNAPNIKMLLSYADPEQLHLGKIYQATNWLYQDCRDIQLMPNYSVSLSDNPHKWIHSRTVFSKWGSHNLEHLKREIGKDGYGEFWRKRELPKHRYIQILGQTKRENKMLRKNLKHHLSEYPKNADDFVPPIENHKTNYVTENTESFW